MYPVSMSHVLYPVSMSPVLSKLSTFLARDVVT